MKKTLKTGIVALLAIMMAFTFVGCNNNSSEESKPSESETTTTVKAVDKNWEKVNNKLEEIVTAYNELDALYKSKGLYDNPTYGQTMRSSMDTAKQQLDMIKEQVNSVDSFTDEQTEQLMDLLETSLYVINKSKEQAKNLYISESKPSQSKTTISAKDAYNNKEKINNKIEEIVTAYNELDALYKSRGLYDNPTYGQTMRSSMDRAKQQLDMLKKQVNNVGSFTDEQTEQIIYDLENLLDVINKSKEPIKNLPI